MSNNKTLTYEKDLLFENTQIWNTEIPTIMRKKLNGSIKTYEKYYTKEQLDEIDKLVERLTNVSPALERKNINAVGNDKKQYTIVKTQLLALILVNDVLRDKVQKLDQLVINDKKVLDEALKQKLEYRIFKKSSEGKIEMLRQGFQTRRETLEEAIQDTEIKYMEHDFTDDNMVHKITAIINMINAYIIVLEKYSNVMYKRSTEGVADPKLAECYEDTWLRTLKLEELKVEMFEVLEKCSAEMKYYISIKSVIEMYRSISKKTLPTEWSKFFEYVLPKK